MKAKDCIIATAYHESDIFSELNFHKFYNNENHDVLHYKGLFKNYHSKEVQITWLKDSYNQLTTVLRLEIFLINAIQKLHMYSMYYNAI